MTDPQRPEISYPCRWSFRIVGPDESKIRDAVSEIVGDEEHTLTAVRQSRTGRYCSLHLEMTVGDEQQRVWVYAALQGHAAVRLVL